MKLKRPLVSFGLILNLMASVVPRTVDKANEPLEGNPTEVKESVNELYGWE